MRALVRMLAAAVALAMTTGSAFAVMGKTTTDVALRRAPSAQAELILNLSQGTLVDVGSCSRGWCGVTWNKYGGYVRESALRRSGPPAVPVFPPYPYKAGHYPTADAYYDLPPYAAIDPSFYRWRHFLTAQERNRYRYMPHIFRGYTGYRDDTVGSYVSSTVSKPISPSSPPKTEPSPPTPEQSPPAPEVSPPPAAPVPSTPAPEVSPPPAAPEPSPQAPEVSPPPAAPEPSPQPEVSPPGPSPQGPEGTLGSTVNELGDATKGWSIKRSILGQPVYNEKNERVGSVDDIVVTRDKSVAYAIVNVGGFLRMTKHNVAIPVSQFKSVDNKIVLPGATRETLKAMPEFQYAQ